MTNLSFRFYFGFAKEVILISGLIIRILLLILLGYLILYRNNQIDVILFLIFYIVVTSIYDYYLLVSKNIKYDYLTLYVQRNKDVWEEIPIKNILRIKRTYHYFYTIHYKISDFPEKKVVFFISPNPPFCKTKKVKEVLSYVQNKNT
jgi:hypothetical protein